MAEKKKQKAINIKNRRAAFDYFITDQYTAGIVLTGTEIKSIREGRASLVDTYCLIINGEMWVKNMYVAEYAFGSYGNHVPRRDRKLLLNRKEISQLDKDSKSPGFTVVPLQLFLDANGHAKLRIGIARGKKEYDKRQTIKENEDRREMARTVKRF